MKTRIFLFFSILCVSSFSFGQRKIIFIDSNLNVPVENVHVFSLNNKLVSISNVKGEVSLDENINAIAKCHRYEDLKFSTLHDTIYLSSKIQLLNEVVVKPIEISELYKRIIDSSKIQAINNSNSQIQGVYFESVLIIDLNSGDSIFQTKECILTIDKKQRSKSNEYTIHASQGRKTYRIDSNQERFDTTSLEKSANIIPKLNSLFEYDFSNEKKFKINFEDKDIVRKINSFKVSENKETHTESFEVDYENGVLTSWNNSNTSNCASTSKMSFCFELTSKTLEYRNDENGYYLMNAFLYGIINIKASGKELVIKLKKGFIENPNSSSNQFVKVNHVEDYFDSIPYSQDAELINMYIFPE